MTPTAAPLQSEQRHGATKNKNPAFSQKRGFGVAMQPLPAERLPHHELLGFGSSASRSGSSGVSSSLGSVSGRSSSVSSRCSGGRSSSVGSGRSCWLGGGSRCCGGSFHRSGCGCWSGFFLLATSGECSSSDQGGQNERVLHFDFPIWTDRILKSHGVRLP